VWTNTLMVLATLLSSLNGLFSSTS